MQVCGRIIIKTNFYWFFTIYSLFQELEKVSKVYARWFWLKKLGKNDFHNLPPLKNVEKSRKMRFLSIFNVVCVFHYNFLRSQVCSRMKKVSKVYTRQVLQKNWGKIILKIFTKLKMVKKTEKNVFFWFLNFLTMFHHLKKSEKIHKNTLGCEEHKKIFFGETPTFLDFWWIFKIFACTLHI